MQSIKGINSSSYGSFGKGGGIPLSGLNKLGLGIDQTRTMQSNDVNFNSSSGGTAYALPQPIVDMSGIGPEGYLNQFHCALSKDEAEGGGFVWTLQVIAGTLIYGDEHQAAQESIVAVSPESPVTIVDGEDPESPYMNNGGYCVIDDVYDYGVYILQVQSNDREKFLNYLYVASTAHYNYPETGFVVYGGAGQEPYGINVPFTDWTMQVIKIANITYDVETTDYSLEQVLIGSQTLPAIQPPIQFKVDVINREQDITAAPNWTLRVARGVVMSSPELPSTCIGVEWINDIDSNCDPYTGDYADSRWTNNGGGIEGLDNSIDYDVYLFKITQDGVSDYVLWAGDNADYTNECPVVLPTNITPSGDYVAQAIHIANVTQPTTADVWVVDQVIQGSITFPSSPPSPEPIENTCPSRIFNIHAAGSKYYINVAPFTVNNRQVTDYDDNPLKTGTVYKDIEVFKTGLTTDALRTNYVYVAGDVDNSTPTAPLYPTNAYIVVKETETAADEEFGLTLLGTVTGYINDADVPVLTINNLKGCGSVWTTRYKCGSYYPAVYWWSGV